MFLPKISRGQKTGRETPVKTPSKATNPIPVKKQGGPIVITGDNLEIDSARKIATYIGNVKVVQGTTSMFSDKLVIYLDQTGKRLEKAVATGNVRLVNDTITATGEEGIFYNAEQKLELNRKAKVWQKNNAITAHQIIAFLQQEIVEGYGSQDERAIMTVYSRDTISTPFGKGSKADNTPLPKEKDIAKKESSPVVIVADKLKLDNPAQQAVFTGNVVATKDITEISSDEMIVYIERTQEAGDDIEKIEVNGNVRIIHETTTITGEKGEYLSKEQYARVEGSQKKKARVEDKAQNMILEAPVIEAYLATNTIKAQGAIKTELNSQKEGGRIRTEFGTDENESVPDTGKPAPGSKNETNAEKDNLPSVTLYPGRKNNSK